MGGGVLAAIFVPLFRKEETLESAILEETQWDLLQRKKEVVLGNVQDLDFEYKCGKLSEGDHQRIREVLDLEPVVRAAAYHFKLLPLAFYTSDDPARDIFGAKWIILTHNTALAAELGKAATHVAIYGDPVLWTDDRSSIYEIIR